MIYDEDEFNDCETCLQYERCHSCSNCKFEDLSGILEPCAGCDPGTEFCMWEAEE